VNNYQNYKTIFGKKESNDKNIIKNEILKENLKIGNTNSKTIPFEIIRGTKSDLKNSKLDHNSNNTNISSKSKFTIIKSENLNSLSNRKFGSTKESSLNFTNNDPLKVKKENLKKEENDIGLNNVVFKKEDVNKKINDSFVLNDDKTDEKIKINMTNVSTSTITPSLYTSSLTLNNLNYPISSINQSIPNKIPFQDQEKIVDEIDEIDSEIFKFENILKTLSNDMKENDEIMKKELSEKSRLINTNKEQINKIENIKDEKKKCEVKKNEREMEIKSEIEERRIKKLEDLKIKREKEERHRQVLLEAKKKRIISMY